MSHTNSTTNYSLPQFVTSDKPAWLTDINNAYTAIDTGMHNAQTKANTADTNASQALLDAASASSAASAADAKGAGAIASLADTFQTTDTYAVGDLVIYNSLLYVCSTAVTDPGAWTGSTNWTRITVESFVNGKTAEDIPLDSSVSAPSTATAISDKISKTADSGIMTCNVGTLSRGSLKKLGDIKYFAFVIYTNQEVPTGTEIITLPSGYSASGSIDCPALYRSGGVDSPCDLWIESNNKIKYNSVTTLTSGSYIFANGWFI